MTRRGRSRARRPSRGRVAARRALALGAVVLVGGGVAWAASALGGDDGGDDAGEREAAPATTSAARARVSARRPLRIVFPEGFTREDMAERIDAVDKIAREKRHVRPRLASSAYLAATASSPLPGRYAGDGKRRPLEGFLFPATYSFLPRTTSAQLVRKQLATFRRVWADVDLRYARSKNLTPYDVLIIASMVEREARVAEERPIIAGVIYNRLRKRMPLQIDATIRYALDVPGTEPLRQSQLRHPTPYNTRIHPGLPPTPIANPGLPSIKAAARPAKVDYLYFVAKPDKKHHFFTDDFGEFQQYLDAHGYGAN